MSCGGVREWTSVQILSRSSAGRSGKGVNEGHLASWELSDMSGIGIVDCFEVKVEVVEVRFRQRPDPSPRKCLRNTASRLWKHQFHLDLQIKDFSTSDHP